jgi:Sulfotransferase family
VNTHQLLPDALLAVALEHQLLECAWMTEYRRASLHFGLAQAYDGRGEWERAAGHIPRVFGAGERSFASQGLQKLPRIMERAEDPLSCVADANRAALAEAAKWHLDQLHRLDGGRADRVADKMPDNYQLLGFLAVLFPQARFIHCRRDLRDVALSCWITQFTYLRWANDLAHIAHRVREYERLMSHWRKALPVPMLEVDYEELIADQEGVSRRLVDWLGLEWDARCLQFHRTERLVRTASVSQVRQPIYRRSVARWRNYKEALAPFLSDFFCDLDR